ncbi:sensor histidine kinase [Halogeometricum limi]|uniref:histidine kinase n=1 Tax=Halogeometricum limi TaxID=555875 RepID=A0A1I6G081_9EURY|nr:histidine kinase N-terminal 7TM domain-containing protein [Halogeometricum limi]SFR35598.1 Signal transduction histidine kinase [Halogeometricum limi]
MLTTSVLVPLLFLSIAMGAAAAILAWRERPEPGATPLVWLLFGQSWWSMCLVFKLRASTLASKLFWTDLEWVGVVIVPVAWLLFALEYTGRDEYITRRRIALLAVVPVLTVVLAVTSQYHDLLFVRPQTLESTDIVRIEEGGLWYWVIAGYTYLLGAAGILLLLGLLRSKAVTFRSQAVALFVGLLIPWSTNALHIAGALPTSGIDPTPIAFSVSGVVYVGALTQFRLLGTSPAPRKRARQFVFDRMREGAIVVDANDNVVDMNDSCVGILDVDPRTTLGASAQAVIPEYDRLPDDGPLDGHLTVGTEAGSHPYDVMVTRIDNIRGNEIGRVITFHDVSRHLRQQQRLQVLNRTLRHNIRTETNIIHGYVDRFASDEDAQIVKKRALRIEELGRKGRKAIELFENGRAGANPRPLDALVAQCVRDVRERYPRATFSYDSSADDAAVAHFLAPVFSNLLENAAEHASDDPNVDVTARVEDETAVVVVADDGPGIGEYELQVLDAGSENALQHGSGLGLWIAKWGTEIAGGEIHFTENEPSGSVVTVRVPCLAEPADEDGE